jgi:hypothetical protein
MFSNYTNVTQVAQEDGCCHKQTTPVTGHNTDVLAQKDEYGNIIKLQWTPNDRFTLNLTSDTWMPIFDSSKVLEEPGETPDDADGQLNMYAYNLSDWKCWKHDGDKWVEQSAIESPHGSSTTVLFSMKNSSTRISIKNFRGDTVYTVENEGNWLPFTVDDTLSQLLLQGYYNIDVYQITQTLTRHIRRISASIGYPSQQYDVTPPNPNSTYVGWFSVDDTLEFKNSVLSVNVNDTCNNENTLPVSGSAVVEYSQPKDLIVEINTDTMTTNYTSKYIHNFVCVRKGNAYCYYDGLYIPYSEGTEESVKFSLLTVKDSVLKTLSLNVDDVGNASDNSISHISFADLTNYYSKEEINKLADDLVASLDYPSRAEVWDDAILAAEHVVNRDVGNVVKSVNEATPDPETGDVTIPTGITKTVLWENASMNSSFNAQNITVDGLADFDEIEVEVLRDTNTSSSQKMYLQAHIPTALGCGSVIYAYFSTSSTMIERQMTITNSTTIKISAPYRAGTTSALTNAVGLLKPFRIYGIKGVKILR